MNDVAAAAPHPTVAKQSTAKYVAGRRAFFKYRDLGVTAATGGKLRAQVTSAEAGMSQPTGWHIHKCEAQLVYMLRGWIDLEFEGVGKVRLSAGDSVMIPGGAPHQETATSDDFEIVEVHSAENDPCICRSGHQSQMAFDCGMQTNAFDFHRALNCKLAGHSKGHPFSGTLGAVPRRFYAFIYKDIQAK